MVKTFAFLISVVISVLVYIILSSHVRTTIPAPKIVLWLHISFSTGPLQTTAGYYFHQKSRSIVNPLFSKSSGFKSQPRDGCCEFL